MDYFSADQHFGHDKIIELCKRPFKNVTEMDNTIIRNHNSIVTDDDDVYYLGDFSLKTSQHRGVLENYVRRLNGRKHLILGNHDIKNPWLYTEIGFWSVHAPYLEVEEFILVQDPALSITKRNQWFLCGHVHDLFRIIENCFNVGVDVNDFKPLSIQQIRMEVDHQ